MKRQFAAMFGLLSLAVLVQIVTIWRAVVPAQDSVRYLVVAQAIGRDGLVPALVAQAEQPVFPAFVWLVRTVLVWSGTIEPANWAICLQLAAAVPLVIATAPVYLLGRHLAGSKAGFQGGILFCCLPEFARLGADGLSDSMHLLWYVLACWAASAYLSCLYGRASEGAAGFSPPVKGGVGGGVWRGRRTRRHGDAQTRRKEPDVGGNRDPRVTVSPRLHVSSAPVHGPRSTIPPPRSPVHGPRSTIPLWLFLCGLCGGMALATRAESLVVPPAVVISVFACHLHQGWRGSWAAALAKGLAASACLAIGLLVVLLPYLAASNSLVLEKAAERLLGGGGAIESPPLNSPVAAARPTSIWTQRRWRVDGAGKLFFGRKDRSTSSRKVGWPAATRELVRELGTAWHYGAFVLAVVGLWAARPRISGSAAFALLVCALSTLCVLRMAATAGYLSTRHVMPGVALSLGFAGAGAIVSGRWLCEVCQSIARRLTTPSQNGIAWGRTAFAGWLMVAVVSASALARTQRPLHNGHGGHRQAAAWLGRQAGERDAVLDSQGWTALYTGRTTYRYEEAQAAFSDPRLTWVVVEAAEMRYKSPRARSMCLLLAKAGEEVTRFSASTGGEQVVVHRWNPERFAQFRKQIHAR